MESGLNRRWDEETFRDGQRNGKLKSIVISATKEIEAIDLFCGAGGLSYGLRRTGIKVVAGFDLDPACEYPFRENNEAKFIRADIANVKGADLDALYSPTSIRLLAGCAPCQPFSTYRQGAPNPTDKRWNLLSEFGRLVRESSPDIITMENVPLLEKQDIFCRFVDTLESLGYKTSFRVVNCADYGVPQFRRRLVMLASRFADISLISPTHKSHLTVRKAIEGLPSLEAGQVDASDPLHQAASLSPTNLKRIRSSRPGGTWRDWDSQLVADCHKKETGQTYPSVYARMSWDEPSPTMTTQFYGFGNGRFGHPNQDRAISLREGAILQSFPKRYRFVPIDQPMHRKIIGRLIGNAVPVKLGEAIGRSIREHIANGAENR